MQTKAVSQYTILWTLTFTWTIHFSWTSTNSSHNYNSVSIRMYFSFKRRISCHLTGEYQKTRFQSITLTHNPNNHNSSKLLTLLLDHSNHNWLTNKTRLNFSNRCNSYNSSRCFTNLVSNTHRLKMQFPCNNKLLPNNSSNKSHPMLKLALTITIQTWNTWNQSNSLDRFHLNIKTIIINPPMKLLFPMKLITKSYKLPSHPLVQTCLVVKLHTFQKSGKYPVATKEIIKFYNKLLLPFNSKCHSLNVYHNQDNNMRRFEWEEVVKS